MDSKDDIVWAFDLDGTIANYGSCVAPHVADKLNELGHVHIISGGKEDHVRKSTTLIKDKSIYGLRAWRGNHSLDLASLLDTPKKGFHSTARHQTFRRDLCVALREAFHSEVYIGGRSTIDITPMRNKGHIIKKLKYGGKKVIYFYDCKWSMNEDINNDMPAIKEAWRSIRTDYTTIITDINACLKTIS